MLKDTFSCPTRDYGSSAGRRYGQKLTLNWYTRMKLLSLYFPELRKGSRELNLRSLRHLLARQLHACFTTRKKMNQVVLVNNVFYCERRFDNLCGSHL